MTWKVACAAVFLVIVSCAGCAQQLMHTPNLIADAKSDPWTDTPPVLRTGSVQVIYASDRARVTTSDSAVRYGYGRSRSLAFGICSITLGEGLSWEELVEQSRRRSRTRSVRIASHDLQEMGRFPETPLKLTVSEDRRVTLDPEVAAAEVASLAAFRALVAERLALTPRKEAFVYVHGFNNTFEAAAPVMAEIWHFLGRQGVPLFYSWPAGSGMTVIGYNYDRESGEFTVYHLKQFLEALAGTPELNRIHLIAHSRGTDVLCAALRELNIKYRARNPDVRNATANELRIGHLVLAAPDIDFDVARQRVEAERLGVACERVTVYTSPDDLAIGFAKWLFKSAVRVGTLGLANLPEDQRKSLAALPNADLIDARVSTGLLGHSYFYTNPAVSSDLILLLRDNKSAGAENGRPLMPQQGSFWTMQNGYPTR